MKAGETKLPKGFGAIWTTVAVDLIGFGIVLPLLPLLAEGSIMFMGEASNSAFHTFLKSYLNHDYKQMEINISLGVVVLALATAIILSMIFPKKPKATEDNEE